MKALAFSSLLAARYSWNSFLPSSFVDSLVGFMEFSVLRDVSIVFGEREGDYRVTYPGRFWA